MESNGRIRATLSGSREVTVLDIYGDDLSHTFPDLDLTDLIDYSHWVEDNFTEGKEIPVCVVQGCSVFTVTTGNGSFAGRNLDYRTGIGSPIIIRNYPTKGYKSIGTAAWESVFETDEPWEDAKKDIRMCAAGMCVLDGINEKGLMCALLVTLNEPPSRTKESTLCTMALTRYLLDHTANVEEAKEFVRKKGFNNEVRLNGNISKTGHLFVRDASGKCVVIESQEGKLHFIENEEADVVTNHCLNKVTTKIPTESSINRYNLLRKEVDNVKGHPGNGCSVDECRRFLKDVAKIKLDGDLSGSLTRWSIVYDFNNMELSMWLNAKFDVQPHVFRFSDMK